MFAVLSSIHHPNMSTKPAAQSVLSHLDFCRQRQAEMLALLQRMVEIESPSDDKAALDGMGEFLGREFEQLGGKVTFDRQKETGNHLKVEFGGKGTGKPVLLLGHFDTVWPMGTLARMPFRTDSG